MSESVKIVEKKPIHSEATMVIGLPDVGRVGLIATSYLITELNLEEIAYMESDLLPPQLSYYTRGYHMRLCEYTEIKT